MYFIIKFICRVWAKIRHFWASFSEPAKMTYFSPNEPNKFDNKIHESYIFFMPQLFEQIYRIYDFNQPRPASMWTHDGIVIIFFFWRKSWFGTSTIPALAYISRDGLLDISESIPIVIELSVTRIVIDYQLIRIF